MSFHLLMGMHFSPFLTKYLTRIELLLIKWLGEVIHIYNYFSWVVQVWFYLSNSWTILAGPPAYVCFRIILDNFNINIGTSNMIQNTTGFTRNWIFCQTNMFFANGTGSKSIRRSVRGWQFNMNTIFSFDAASQLQ